MRLTNQQRKMRLNHILKDFWLDNDRDPMTPFELIEWAERCRSRGMSDLTLADLKELADYSGVPSLGMTAAVSLK